MLIRKLFKYEASHRVFDAYSRRCSHSVHGHSYVVEYIFEGKVPDNAQMVMDFGFVKKYFHPFVDSFDHCHMIWTEKSDEHYKFFTEYNERWAAMPFSSTAEMQAKMFFTYGFWSLRKLKSMNLINDRVMMHSVKVHETDTGYAEFRDTDYHSCQFPRVKLESILFSAGIIKDWSEDYLEFYNDVVKSS